MKLSLNEAAQLLQVSERTIRRWVEQLGLPSDGDLRDPSFSRSELIEWADAHSLRLAMEVPGEQDTPLPELGQALSEGGIHRNVQGTQVEDALRGVTQALPLPELVEREFFLQVLLAREDLGSTGIGEGVAIPHVRSPLVLHVDRPILGLFFLENPIDWNAIDGKPVERLFAIVSPGVRAHLHLLSRIAFALKDPELQGLLVRQAPDEEIWFRIREIDERVRP